MTSIDPTHFCQLTSKPPLPSESATCRRLPSQLASLHRHRRSSKSSSLKYPTWTCEQNFNDYSGVSRGGGSKDRPSSQFNLFIFMQDVLTVTTRSNKTMQSPETMVTPSWLLFPTFIESSENFLPNNWLATLWGNSGSATELGYLLFTFTRLMHSLPVRAWRSCICVKGYVMFFTDHGIVLSTELIKIVFHRILHTNG